MKIGEFIHRTPIAGWKLTILNTSILIFNQERMIYTDLQSRENDLQLNVALGTVFIKRTPSNSNIIIIQIKMAVSAFMMRVIVWSASMAKIGKNFSCIHAWIAVTRGVLNKVLYGETKLLFGSRKKLKKKPEREGTACLQDVLTDG